MSFAAFAPTSAVTGRTLYRFVFQIGRSFHTCEQLHENQEQAERAALVVAADWAGGRRFAVLHVYPCPGAGSADSGLSVGGP